METNAKPRVSLAQYEEMMKRKPTYAPYSVADILERYIKDMNGTDTVRGVKPLLSGHIYGLRMLQRFPIGSKDARKLTKTDIIEHCKWRREKVKGSTVNQDITYLRGPLAYAPSAWDDCEAVSAGAIEAARPLLVKYNLIGKGIPRTQVSTEDEDERLLAFFADADQRSRIKMVSVILFALATTRRRSEVCRIELRDIDWDHKDEDGLAAPRYMVRDVKHPTRKMGNHKWAPIFPEIAEIIQRQPTYHAYMEKVQLIGKEKADEDLDRLFPYNSASVGAKYTDAKKKLGIGSRIRFHDLRRKSTTHYLKYLPPHKVMLITFHENTNMLETRYYAKNPDGLHAELAALRAAPAIARY